MIIFENRLRNASRLSWPQPVWGALKGPPSSGLWREATKVVPSKIKDESKVRLVNREIRGTIAGFGPGWRRKPADAALSSPLSMVPPLSPAALEPFWLRGRLVLPQNSAESDRESVVMATSFRLLREKISALAADPDGGPALGQRSLNCLRSVAARIPGHAPVQDELFYLAHVRELLEEYAGRFGAQWTEFFAERFTDAMLHFEHTLRQFPRWRAFVSNAEEGRLSAEEAAGVPALANLMAAALRENDAQIVVSPAISSSLDVFRAPLQNLQKRAGAGETGKFLLVHDLFWSIENAAKRLAEAVLESTAFDAQLGPALEPVRPWMAEILLKILHKAPAFGLQARFHWLFLLAGDLLACEEPPSNSPSLEDETISSSHC